MTKLLLILITALVLEAVGVVYLSKGVKQIGELHQYNAGEIVRVVRAGFTNPYIWIGLGLETVFFILLLVLLHGWDVSLIWPLTSLGFVLTTISAKYIRHEEVSTMRWSGVILIVAGAILVGYSEKAKRPPTGVPDSQISPGMK